MRTSLAVARRYMLPTLAGLLFIQWSVTSMGSSTDGFASVAAGCGDLASHDAFGTAVTTAAVATVSVATSGACDFADLGIEAATAAVTGTASLRTGTLTASSNSNGAASGGVTVSFADGVHIVPPHPGVVGVINLQEVLNGGMFGAGQAGGVDFDITLASFGIAGGQFLERTFQIGPGIVGIDKTIPITYNSGFSDLAIVEQLSVETNGCSPPSGQFPCGPAGSGADFTHTAGLVLMLPSGWMYTSDSGFHEFNGGSSTVVSESSSIWLLNTGLLLVVFV